MGAAGREKAERLWSWPRLLDRMDDAYAEAIAARRREARMNLLLVAYFYPPCRDTGAHRPAAMAKWLRRLGHRVTVLTTSAYGTGDGADEEDVVRTPDLQRLRARLHGHDRVDALFDSDTYSGRPHPLSQGARPRAAGRRLGAVRALARRCGSTAASASTA